MKENSGRFTKGHTPWHKGKTSVYSEETLKKMSDAKVGKPNWRKGVVGKYKHTDEWKQRESLRRMGHPTSDETKAKIGLANKGERNAMWKGGIWDGTMSRTAKNYAYKKFRLAVLERDKCCVQCGSVERLEVDHILPYAQYVDLQLDIDNARVLCRSCHKQTDTYGRSVKVCK